VAIGQISIKIIIKGNRTQCQLTDSGFSEASAQIEELMVIGKG